MTWADVTNYIDAAVVPGQEYHYRVRATNVPGDSDFSNETELVLPAVLRFEPGNSRYDSNGLFHLQLTAPANSDCIIQASLDLTNWIALATNSVTDGKLDIIDTNAISFGTRFYRALRAR